MALYKKKPAAALLSTSMPCDKHPERQMCAYCMTCDDPICLRCLFDHHRHHECLELELAAKAKREVGLALVRSSPCALPGRSVSLAMLLHMSSSLVVSRRLVSSRLLSSPLVVSRRFPSSLLASRRIPSPLAVSRRLSPFIGSSRRLSPSLSVARCFSPPLAVSRRFSSSLVITRHHSSLAICRHLSPSLAFCLSCVSVRGSAQLLNRLRSCLSQLATVTCKAKY